MIIIINSEFYNKFERVKNIFKTADEKLNFSISKLILEGPSDKLQLTKNTQPAILTVSYSIFEILKKDEESLGIIFTYFMLETVIVGKLANINPFDQPAVEEVKVDTKKILS